VKPLTLRTKFPGHRAKIRFKDYDKDTFVISAEKAGQDAKNFREAASLIPSTERGAKVAQWLNDLARDYERGEV
jgi:hypothetical protein